MQALPLLRRVAAFVLVVLMMPGVSALAQNAASVPGTWDYTVEVPDGNLVGTLNITSDGSTLGGTVNPSNGDPLVIKNGQLQGSNMSFQIEHSELGVMTIKLAVDGNAFKGELSLPNYGSLPMTGTKRQTSFSTATTKIRELMANEKSKAVLEKHLPGISNHPQLDQALDYSLEEIAPYASELTADKLKAIQQDLEKL